MSENHLCLRSSGLPHAVGKSSSGLVLIEKPDVSPSVLQQRSNSSLISEEILRLAKIEATRMRHEAASAHAKGRSYRTDVLATQMQKSEPSFTRRSNPIVSETRPKVSKSATSVRSGRSGPSEVAQVDQLEHLRNEIESMASQLADEVPSDLEDVDKDFDDESNRWFAREFYAVKHESTLIKRMRDTKKQRNGVVKLHRTALRLMQVAVNRPILRVLNPHIYAQLGDLVRELVEFSNKLDLPLWDPHSILDALEQAVYFPPRKQSNRRGSINPSDMAELLKPKNRKSHSRIKLRETNVTPEPKFRRSPLKKLEAPKKVYSEPLRSAWGPPGPLKRPSTGGKKKSILKTTQSAPGVGSKTRRDSKGLYRRKSGPPDRHRGVASSTPSARLVEIDSFSEPIESVEFKPRPINTREPARQRPPAPIDSTASAFPITGRPVELPVEQIKPGPALEKTDHEVRAKWSNFNLELDRIEREEREIRVRLAQYEMLEQVRPVERRQGRREPETAQNHLVPVPEMFEIQLLRDATAKPFIRKPSELQLERAKESQIVNTVAESLLGDIVADVLQDTEDAIGGFVNEIYTKELNGVEHLNPMSFLSSTILSDTTSNFTRSID